MNYSIDTVNPGLIVLIAVLAVWSAIWKAIALWRAGRRANLVWFVVMCIFNTLGILEIIYIFAVSRRRPPTPVAG